MRIGVISRDAELATTARFIATGRELGHEVSLLPLLDLSVVLDAGGPELRVAGSPTPALDRSIPRLGAYLSSLALAAARALEATAVEPLNRAAALETAFDKLRTAERLVAAGIPTPRTILVKDLDRLEAGIDAVGGPPVVIKPLTGAQGRGVMLAESRAAAVAILENLILTGRDHLVQALVPGSVGEDRRLLVLDGEVIGAVRRVARPGEFRPNVHRGGSVEAIEADATEVALAISAAAALGLRFAGVDLLQGDDGPTVVEVNGSPGLEGIERATGVDLASQVIVALTAPVNAPREVGDGLR